MCYFISWHFKRILVHITVDGFISYVLNCFGNIWLKWLLPFFHHHVHTESLKFSSYDDTQYIVYDTINALSIKLHLCGSWLGCYHVAMYVGNLFKQHKEMCTKQYWLYFVKHAWSYKDENYTK